MKKLYFSLVFILGLWSMLNAQWVSPGNGTTYTIEDLVEVSNGCVMWIDGNQQYRIENDLTIQPTTYLMSTIPCTLTTTSP